MWGMIHPGSVARAPCYADAMAERDTSLDILKGIGIAAVAFGHIWSEPLTRLVYIFHMPLFFLVSGMLFRPSASFQAALLKYARRILVPYFFFLFFLQLDKIYFALSDGGIQALLHFAGGSFLGGEKITGRVGVFWFPSCLFLTLVSYQAVHAKLRGYTGYLVTLGLMSTSYSLQFFAPDFWLPWAANLLPMSLVMFHLGHSFRQRSWSQTTEKKVLITSLLVSGIYFSGIYWDNWRVVTMKGGAFGWPGITLLASFAIVFVLLRLSRLLTRIGPIQRAFSLLGTSSLLIMYLHQAIQMIIRDTFVADMHFLRLLVCLSLPILIDKSAQRYRWTRRLMLGQS